MKVHFSLETQRRIVCNTLKDFRAAYAKDDGYSVTLLYHQIEAYWFLDFISEKCFRRAGNMWGFKGVV